ncbi:hypothetical protein BIFDEN_01101 [Bifidobacterium dentium ATCC 27678]|nr:hypothetical protein BIFDEN_01101 [Bifidobacterium dentium ATCC 27678]
MMIVLFLVQNFYVRGRLCTITFIQVELLLVHRRMIHRLLRPQKILRNYSMRGLHRRSEIVQTRMVRRAYHV